MPTSTLFELPAEFLTNVYAAVAAFLTSNLMLPVALICGIALAMWGLNYVIGKFTSRGKVRG
ncbi:hypothetical protein MUP06_00955 [Patescibacteria group bacterium]|nr:hypothetical protein [Patescibacteria group bacterium]